MKSLIFDFDGTLADSFALLLDIAYEVTGVPRLPDAELEKLRQLPLIGAVRHLRIPLYRLPKLLLSGRQLMHDRLSEVGTFANMSEVLAELHRRGYDLYVMSSNSEMNVRVFLRNNNLEQLFTAVYGNASVINKAGAIKNVLRQHSIPASDAYYIGDEIRDMTAAHHVGVPAVGVTWGFQAPEALERTHPFAVAKKPADLLQIFPK